MMGATAQIESYCAVRVSLTRKEMAVMTATAISPKSGVPAMKRMSQPPVTTWGDDIRICEDREFCNEQAATHPGE